MRWPPLGVARPRRRGGAASTCCRSAAPRTGWVSARPLCSSMRRWPTSSTGASSRRGSSTRRCGWRRRRGWGCWPNGVWLANARHANAMAKRLADGIERLPGVRLMYPVEANAVFADIAPSVQAALREKGWQFYTFLGATGCRLMCAWDTSRDGRPLRRPIWHRRPTRRLNARFRPIRSGCGTATATGCGRRSQAGRRQ